MPAKGGGISGLAVAVAATGGFLVYAGIKDVPLLDGLREIVSGKTPTGRPQNPSVKFGSAVGTAAGDIASGVVTQHTLAGSQPHVKLALNEIGNKYGIKTIGGLRIGDPGDHGRGLAGDLMIDNIPNGTSVGGSMAAYMVSNNERLGLTYVIWSMRIASASRGWVWRPYVTSVRTGDWQHVRHVHGSFKPIHTYRPPTGSGTSQIAV